ncbi:MAG TPA: hypothetical protein VMV47_04935 [Bacteroidales bacterium]|nr:hypothetical protein [Bacteroidales bacterium]
MENTVNPNTDGKSASVDYSKAQSQLNKEVLITHLSRSYGNEFVSYYNSTFFPKIKNQAMTHEELAKLIYQDDYLKLVMSSISQRKLGKIHFWVVFWSVLSIIGFVFYFLSLLMNLGGF